MTKHNRIFVGLGLIQLLAILPCNARSTPAPFSSRIKHTRLAALPISPGITWERSSCLSPDGRWLAYFDARSKNRDRVIFYNLFTSKNWTVDAGNVTRDAGGEHILAWSRDSRTCAIGAAIGWKIASPVTRRTRLISSQSPSFGSCAAWSPRTNRLAIFDGNRSYQVWNGKRLSREIDWVKVNKLPATAAENAWQCEWSPDEKLLLLRFYGESSMRSSDMAGHTIIINPRTARHRFNWGDEAGPARWLDQSRLMFEAGNFMVGPSEGLTVAKPSTGQSNIWYKNVIAWTLSSRRDTAWLLTGTGDLLRTSTRKKQWQVIRRQAVPKATLTTTSPGLLLSSRGDMLACYNEGDQGSTSLSLFSASSRRPWTIAWRPPSGTVKLLGWPKGKSLPLLEWQPKDDGPTVIIQLTK